MADDSSTPLFDPSLISPQVSSALPEGYTIRPLQKSDREGMLDVLRVLTTVGDISEEGFRRRFDEMAGPAARQQQQQGEGGQGYGRGAGYYILVVADGQGRIVGTGGLIVEKKFIHDLGLVGHIEDIAVAKDQQGKKLGLRIIQALDYVAEKVGCYKSILDCSEHNEGFYLRCGFKRGGTQMSHYYDSPK